MARFLDRSLSSRTTRIVATFTPFRTIYIPPTSTMTIYGVDPVTPCMGLRNGSSHADTMWRSHGAYPTAWVIRSHIKSRRSPERTVSQRARSRLWALHDSPQQPLQLSQAPAHRSNPVVTLRRGPGSFPGAFRRGQTTLAQDYQAWQPPPA